MEAGVLTESYSETGSIVPLLSPLATATATETIRRFGREPFRMDSRPVGESCPCWAFQFMQNKPEQAVGISDSGVHISSQLLIRVGRNRVRFRSGKRRGRDHVIAGRIIFMAPESKRTTYHFQPRTHPVLLCSPFKPPGAPITPQEAPPW